MQTQIHPLISPTLGTERHLTSFHCGPAGVLFARQRTRFARAGMVVGWAAGAGPLWSGSLLPD